MSKDSVREWMLAAFLRRTANMMLLLTTFMLRLPLPTYDASGVKLSRSHSCTCPPPARPLPLSPHASTTPPPGRGGRRGGGRGEGDL